VFAVQGGGCGGTSGGAPSAQAGFDRVGDLIRAGMLRRLEITKEQGFGSLGVSHPDHDLRKS
jgi:hypothetical protein